MSSAPQSSRHQQALAQFGEFVLDHDGLDEILTEACRLVAHGLDVDLAKVIEIDHADNTGLIRAGVGWNPGVVGQERVSLTEKSSEAFAVAKAVPVITNDIAEEDRFDFPQFLIDHGVVAVVNVPIFLPGRRPFGLLQVDAREPRKFGEPDINFLNTYAMVLGPVIDRHQAASALKAADERLQLIENARAYIMVVCDRSGQITGWLGGSEDILGWSADDAIGQPLSMIFTDEDCAAGVPAQELAKARENGSATNLRWHQRRDGSRVFLDGQSIAVKDRAGRPSGFLKIAQDVTERMRIEAALKQSEARLQQFGEASQDMLWMRDAQTLQWQYLTPAFETIFGFPRETALEGDNFEKWMNLILEEDRAQVHEAVERVLAGEHASFDYRIRRPVDGMIRWLHSTAFPIFGDDGEVAVIGGVGHDLTELRETELRLEVLMAGIPQLVWRADERGDWTWSSPQWTDYTGCTEEESNGDGWLKAFHPDDREAARAAWSDALRTGQFEVEARIRNAATREYRWFQTRALPVRADGGSIIEWLGTSTDIHQIHELQARQKVLVAELQHRTRNLMAVVHSISNKTVRSSADLDDFKERFGHRIEALSRVQALLSQLDPDERVTFDALIKAELDALGGQADQITLEGPEGVRLRSSSVQTLAMALHELATNAVKHGALSQTAAKITIRWSVQRDPADARPVLHIDWRETGVAMPTEPEAAQRFGHGRELIERALPHQLDAVTSFTLTPDGVHCTIALRIMAG
ncbi:MAG: PAS domain-containing protein [Erythrobacter sp.]|uniref:PAS domain-containing protein n=1 Tax=Erythrobacter sp. TaxID=1042 RepID=UPI0025F763AF|nr:PAS domain-containing protein [Erythrobacter sp.]MCL9998976.1 PAS domain-containing protein [Erythrobacter sp.]